MTAMVELKNENKRLYKRVDELREEQLSLQSQVRETYETSNLCKCIYFKLTIHSG